MREALFSTLFSRLGNFSGKKVLDLFAGTGAMALEAISRGAESAILIDHSRDAGQIISQNLQTTGLADKAKFHCGKVMSALPLIAKEGPFDLIFLDPPYADQAVEEVILAVIHFGLLASDGMICVETSRTVSLPEQIGEMSRSDLRKYGSTAITLYQQSPLGVETE